jgi:release factor glutamine methyltransferase
MQSWRQLPILPIQHQQQPLPQLPSINKSQVYEPSDDSYLFVDVLYSYQHWLETQLPNPICLEIGGGSGILTGCLIHLKKQKINLSSTFHIITDINSIACLTSQQTIQLNNTNKNQQENHNNIASDVINMDLLHGLRLENNTSNNNNNGGLFDLLLFNPPYVPTPDDEISTIQYGIEAAWAGGNRGRVVIDRLLPQLDVLMSKKSILFMLFVEENDPDEIVSMLWSKGGFQSRLVGMRKAQNERLLVIMSWRGDFDMSSLVSS